MGVQVREEGGTQMDLGSRYSVLRPHAGARQVNAFPLSGGDLKTALASESQSACSPHPNPHACCRPEGCRSSSGPTGRAPAKWGLREEEENKQRELVPAAPERAL